MHSNASEKQNDLTVLFQSACVCERLFGSRPFVYLHPLFSPFFLLFFFLVVDILLFWAVSNLGWPDIWSALNRWRAECVVSGQVQTLDWGGPQNWKSLIWKPHNVPAEWPLRPLRILTILIDQQRFYCAGVEKQVKTQKEGEREKVGGIEVFFNLKKRQYVK